MLRYLSKVVPLVVVLLRSLGLASNELDFHCATVGQSNETQSSITRLLELMRIKTVLELNREETFGEHLANGIKTTLRDFYATYKPLSELVDDPRIRTICEIGPSDGYSSLAFLVLNPLAKLIAFDVLDSSQVGTADLELIRRMLPDRKIVSAYGPPEETIPRFGVALRGEDSRCNVIYIHGIKDSGDIVSLVQLALPLADPNYNILAIDTESDALSIAWTELISDTDSQTNDNCISGEEVDCRSARLIPADTNYTSAMDRWRFNCTDLITAALWPDKCTGTVTDGTNTADERNSTGSAPGDTGHKGALSLALGRVEFGCGGNLCTTNKNSESSRDNSNKVHLGTYIMKGRTHADAL
jgi:hypothetical protein